MTIQAIASPLVGGVQAILPRLQEYWATLPKNASLDLESGRGLRPRGRYRVHGSASKALVVLYSLLNRCSIGYAAEELNAIVVAIDPTRYPRFKDDLRRRAVPHQSDVSTLIDTK